MKSTSTAANKVGNKLGAEGVRPLGDALEVNTTLKTLDLACFQNKIQTRARNTNINDKSSQRDWIARSTCIGQCIEEQHNTSITDPGRYSTRMRQKSKQEHKENTSMTGQVTKSVIKKHAH